MSVNIEVVRLKVVLKHDVVGELGDLGRMIRESGCAPPRSDGGEEGRKGS